ncbi:hypothetical protein V3C99_012898, partial [Haemonchus contortus]
GKSPRKQSLPYGCQAIPSGVQENQVTESSRSEIEHQALQTRSQRSESCDVCSLGQRWKKNFSCMDNIHAVCQLIERSREYRLPLALLFVDYKKAFDSVEINAVLNALVQAGV